MYGIKVNETYALAYETANGLFIPEKFIPEGYRGLIRGRVYRSIDGVEMWDDDFMYGQDPDSMEVDEDLSNMLYYRLNSYVYNFLVNIPAGYHWQVETTKESGIMIDFFLPEKVPELPALEFVYNDEEFFIMFESDDIEEDQ